MTATLVNNRQLSPQEIDHYLECVDIIENGMDAIEEVANIAIETQKKLVPHRITASEVAEALYDIKTQQLWRHQYDSWTAFCREKLGKTRSYAYRLVRAWKNVLACSAQTAQRAQLSLRDMEYLCIPAEEEAADPVQDAEYKEVADVRQETVEADSEHAEADDDEEESAGAELAAQAAQSKVDEKSAVTSPAKSGNGKNGKPQARRGEDGQRGGFPHGMKQSFKREWTVTSTRWFYKGTPDEREGLTKEERETMDDYLRVFPPAHKGQKTKKELAPIREAAWLAVDAKRQTGEPLNEWEREYLELHPTLEIDMSVSAPEPDEQE